MTRDPEALSAEEERKFRESVSRLAEFDLETPQWTNDAAARLLATLDRERAAPAGLVEAERLIELAQGYHDSIDFIGTGGSTWHASRDAAASRRELDAAIVALRSALRSTEASQEVHHEQERP